MKYTKKIITVKEIQEILQISEKTAYKLVRQALETKEFKVLKIGGVYRISLESFLNWIDGIDE